MAASTQSAESEPIFGVIQGFSLGTLILLSALLAVPLHKFNIDGQVGALVPKAHFGIVSLVLWIIELALYGVLAGRLARHVLIGIVGLVVGVCTRFILIILMAILISSQGGTGINDFITSLDHENFLYRILVIVMTGCIFILPLRRLLETGFGMLEGPPMPKTSSSRPKQFSFANKAAHTGHYQVVRSTPAGHAAGGTATTTAPVQAPTQAARSHHPTVSPPEGFTPVIPRDNVFGTVTVPASVILASVPEALPFLERDKPVTIHLAYLVPQLSRGTAWLLWQQIFTSAGGTGRSVVGDADASVRDRWVKLSPKYFIAQVPREYFELQRIPPAWMRLPEVPQEHQFQDE